MAQVDVTHLATRLFRSAAEYELVVYDRLPLHEQAALAELATGHDFYGVLKPRGVGRRTIKTVGRDTALLWLTLQEPGTLPFFVWHDDPQGAAEAIVDLLLDGVLEIEEGGRFVSGADAAPLLLGTIRSLGSVPVDRLARLSLDALRYGEALALDDPAVLAGRLYAFHRQPLTPSWAARLPDDEAVLAFLGAAPEISLRLRIEALWRRAAPGESPGWIAWSPRDSTRPRANGRSTKLYLSPTIESLPTLFAETIAEMVAAGPVPFKVGADAAGLLRPDKMVLYFRDLDDLQEMASRLSRRLSGIAVHGVPFSAEIAGDGLLSWGMDPPRSERLLSWQESSSWRVWVVRRLAAALLAAQDGGSSTLSPSQFALERLRREGVDVDRWTPSAAIWQT